MRGFSVVLACLTVAQLAESLQNGLGLTPPMGYSSWNDCASEITEARVKNVTLALISTGLAAKGFVHVNVDEGWLKGRLANGSIFEDKVKFPSGMRALGAWIHDQVVPGKGKIMKYGLYTCRGTCQCSTQLYHGPGSHGHVKEDAQWLADAGADYLKEDSCCGDQDHTVAFGDYAEMRDALNATGRSVYFSLCGWNTWYAPQGDRLGNSWRIAGDGTNWGALSECANKNSKLQQFARPGAWNDPDLLQGTGKGSNDKATNPSGCYDPKTMRQTEDWYQTKEQARAQFSLWAVMSSPLLIAADPGQVEPMMIETWGNEEVIAVSQNFRQGGPYQGGRISGGDLMYDPQKKTGKGTNVWGKRLPGGAFALVFINNEDTATNVTCDAACFGAMFRVPPPVPHAPTPSTCHEPNFPDKLGDVQCMGLSLVPDVNSTAACCAACDAASASASAGLGGASCETWQFCGVAQPCATGLNKLREKSPGCYIGKQADCSNSTSGWVSEARAPAPPPPAGPPQLAARDLWAHQDLPALTRPYSLTATLQPHGGVGMYLLK